MSRSIEAMGKGTGRIVGATLVSARAGETVPLRTAFVPHELPLEALAEVGHCDPSRAEVLERIADNDQKAAKVCDEPPMAHPS